MIIMHNVFYVFFRREYKIETKSIYIILLFSQKDIVSFKAKRHTEKKKQQKYSEVNTGVYIVNSSYAKLGW